MLFPNSAYVSLCSTAPSQVLKLEAEFLFQDTDINSINRMWDLEINITWAEPMFPNGEIDSDNVTLFETDNPSTVVAINAALTTTSVTAPVIVPAFTDYTGRGNKHIIHNIKRRDAHRQIRRVKLYPAPVTLSSYT